MKDALIMDISLFYIRWDGIVVWSHNLLKYARCFSILVSNVADEKVVISV